MLKIISSVLVCYFFLLIITNVHGFSVLDDTDSSALINHFVVEDIILPNNTIELRRVKRRGTEVEKTSLVIVFDATASMGNDLVQMRTGAIYLIKKFHERIDNPIANYILVVFMDPAIAPTFETVDKDVIINKLNSVVLNSVGNYDCPELSISGLINGLSVAKDKPYVFLFTDAGAKDYYREAEVTKLIQKKEPIITIFHTNDECSGDRDIHPLYYKLAEISNGEVHRLEREDISSVISSLDTMIDKKRVNLIYTTHPNAGNHTTTVDVDATMDELTFSISGSKPWVKIFDPDHREYHEFKKLIDLKNVQTIQILNPQAGKWNIDAGAASANSVKLTAISNVIFSYGFSVEVPLTILSTSYLPLAGFQNILSISVSDATMIRTLETVKIVAPSEEFELPLKKVQAGIEELYLTEKFALPSKPFKIYISGRDKNNNKLERLLTPALTTTKGENPETNLPFTKIEASEDENISLLCHVVSLVPVNMKWIKESTGQVIAEMDTKQGNLLNHTLTDLKMGDSGTYVCIAQNSIGKSETKTVLQVRAIPLTLTTPFKNLTPLEGANNVILKCSVKPIRNVEVKWLFNGNPLLPTNDIVFQLPNIIMNNVKRSQSGLYTCIATKLNNGDTKRDSITLTVKYPPKIAEPATETFKLQYGSRQIIYCNSDGEPKPTKIWKIATRTEQKMVSNLEHFDVTNMNANDEGTYSCEISNSIGLPVIRTVTLNVQANSAPIIIKPNIFVVNAKIGANIELECKCNLCGPLTTHQWDKDSTKLLTNPLQNSLNFQVKNFEEIIKNGNNFFKQEQYNLKINQINENQGGVYKCILGNEFGNDNLKYIVQILKPPKITSRLLPAVKVIPPNPVSLSCDAIGFPEPEVFWLKEGQIVGTNHILHLEPNNVSLAGRYSCTGKNSEGEVFESVDVFPIVKPTLDNTINTRDLYVESINNPLYITCPFSGEDEVIWIKDGKEISKEKQLSIHSLQRNMDGTIFCIAKNLAGSVQRKFVIEVQFPPTNLLIASWYKKYEKLKPNGIIEVALTIGEDFELVCKAEANPEAKFLWRKHNKLISMNEVLLISEVKIEDDGIYTCEAKNNLNRAMISYRLIVNAPPIYGKYVDNNGKKPQISCDFLSPTSSISVSDEYMKADHVTYIKINSGDELIMNCTVNGNPQPDINWFKNGVALTFKSDIITLKGAKSLNSGFYKCTRRNAFGKIDILFNVDVLEKAKMKTTQITNVIEGEQLQLKCTAIGNTVPLLTWTKDGGLKITAAQKDFICKNSKQLQNEGKIYISTKGTKISYELAIRSTIYGILKYKNDINEISLEMIIPKVKTSDAGIYSCIGINSGRETSESQVFVLVPPFYDQSLFPKHRIVQIVTNFTINLRCPIIGEPFPQISWFKDNFTLHLNNNMNIEYNGRQLSIKNSKEEDSGFYECRGINEVGDTKMTFEVTVEVPVIDRVNNRTLYNLNENIDVVEGDNLTLICPTGGSHSARAVSQWSKIVYRKDREILIKNQSLYLENVEESAIYICTIKHKKHIIEKMFNVNVKQIPKFYKDERTQTLKVDLLKQLHLDCSVNADPIPNVIWIKNDIVQGPWRETWIDTKDNQVLYKGATLEDKGKYDCIVQNYLGTVQKTFYVDIIATPYWTAWGHWSNCSKPCGVGDRTKRRYCLLSNGDLADTIGASCGDNDIITQPCMEKTCPIHGGWGDWTDFSECSLACVSNDEEVSTRYRTRFCNNPQPNHGGNDCDGSPEDTLECTVPFCPVDGFWSEFSQWSPCSTTCGYGISSRTRICSRPQNGGANCEGEPMEIKDCYVANCPDPNEAKTEKPPGVCDVGYSYSTVRQTCQDIDECKGKSPCHTTQICMNTPGSFICKCRTGFETFSRNNYAKCLDINECTKNLHNCEHLCANLHGSFQCMCHHGYILHSDGQSCIQRRRKRNHFDIKNQPIKCSHGYYKQNETCIDINECEENNSCGKNETCLNIDGSFLCFPTDCPNYFKQNNDGKCIQICDELPNKKCMDNVKIGQVIQYKMLSLNEVLPDKTFLEITGYSDENYNSTVRTIFSFDNQIDKFKFKMYKNLMKTDTMNLQVHLNIKRKYVHTLKITAKTYDSTGINLLYLINYWIYIFIF